jgi:hypothetical protein
VNERTLKGPESLFAKLGCGNLSNSQRQFRIVAILD